MVSYRFIYSIWYCTNSYIIFYQFVFCIVPIPISYHTDSYCIVPICISYHTDMYHIVLICILPMVLLPWKWTSNWEIWGNWPMSLTFLVVQFNFNLLLGQDSVQSVQWSMTWAKPCHWEIWGNWPMSLTFFVEKFNSNLLLGQASVHSVQWSMTWVKRLPPLSCSSILVVATPSELFLRSLFIWRQLSFERCSNLWGSLWPTILQLNTIGFRLNWLILTMLCHAELLTILQWACSSLQCWLMHTVKFFWLLIN